MTRLNYRTIAGLAGLAFTLYNMWRRRPDYVARQMSRAAKAHPVQGAVV